MIIRPYPGFIIPTPRFIDVGMPKGRMCASGRFKLFKVKNGVRTGEETPWFDNIILDAGLNRWGTGLIISGAAIGTGNTSTPAATDVGLESETHFTPNAGTGHNVITAAGVSPYDNTRTVVYRTVLGQLNGNYVEVGVGWGTGTMFSRALILNGSGFPTSISVAIDEQLDIVYQLSVFPPLADTVNVVTISGVDYTITGRPAQVNATGGAAGGWAAQVGGAIIAPNNGYQFYSGGLGAVTTVPSGTTGGGFALPTTNAYVNLSLQRTATYTQGLTQANVAGGIRSALFSWGRNTGSSPDWLAAFQYEFSPVIPKDATKTLALNYSLNWARRP